MYLTMFGMHFFANIFIFYLPANIHHICYSRSYLDFGSFSILVWNVSEAHLGLTCEKNCSKTCHNKSSWASGDVGNSLEVSLIVSPVKSLKRACLNGEKYDSKEFHFYHPEAGRGLKHDFCEISMFTSSHEPPTI